MTDYKELSGKLTEPFDSLPIGEEVDLVNFRGVWLLNYGSWKDSASIELSLEDVAFLQGIIK